MGGDCKSPGSAFEGSNPSPATRELLFIPSVPRCNCATFHNTYDTKHPHSELVGFSFRHGELKPLQPYTPILEWF